MSDRIEEIRERLEKATPGPWEDDGVNVTQANGEWVDVTPSRVECMSYCYGGSVERMKDDDRTFIANAPADVAFLLAEVERLEREKADAWDEGHRVGMSGWLESVNPYRKEET